MLWVGELPNVGAPFGGLVGDDGQLSMKLAPLPLVNPAMTRLPNWSPTLSKAEHEVWINRVWDPPLEPVIRQLVQVSRRLLPP